MGATTIVTRASKGSSLTPTEMDTNLTNLNNVGTYVGSIIVWPSTVLPDSTWLECAGQSLATASYPDLFSVIGYTYGGAGANFTVPNTRGLFVRGWSNGNPFVDPGRVFGSFQADDIRSHSHTIKAGTHDTPTGPYANADNVNDATSISTEAFGGSETRPYNIAMMYIIKAKKN